jgi:hypothetical protein
MFQIYQNCTDDLWSSNKELSKKLSITKEKDFPSNIHLLGISYEPKFFVYA